MASTSKENPTVAVDMETLENSSTSDEISMVAVDMETLENSSRISKMAKNMQKLMDDKLGLIGSKSEESAQEYMISRVVDSIRKEGEHEYYEPKIISIGPIHRDKEALKPMEVLKLKYLRELISRNPEKNTLENYVKNILSVEEKARKVYSESVKLGDDFVEMMVLDGCFLIEFLVKAYNCDYDMDLIELNLNLNLNLNLRLNLLQRDLLLLENQIPFFILQVLFDSTYIPTNSWDNWHFHPKYNKGGTPTLADLIVYYVFSDRLCRPFRLNSLLGDQPKDVLHLFHVYHKSLNPSHYHTSGYSLAKKMRRIGRLAVAPFLLLLSCLLTCKIPTNLWGDRLRDFFYITVYSSTEIPSATKLCNRGVNFKKKTKAEGEKCFAVDATFDKEESILEADVPEILTFRNLIAFEQMYPKADYYITSHALLMACLIRTAKDVAILRDSGIIESMLKKDIQVVEVFAQFLKGFHFDYERNNNQKLFEDVIKYCTAAHHYRVAFNRVARYWIVDFKRTYFKNPWTVASMIAAILILLLTFAQTFYTIYAYHHPPSI